MPDLSWLRTADADTRATVALLLLCGLVIVTALAARYGHHAAPARRFVGRWARRGGRWVAARWAARWQGCPCCDHCLTARRTATRARWAAIPRPHTGGRTHYIPAQPTRGDR